jgi:hypothetical protein
MPSSTLDVCIKMFRGTQDDAPRHSFENPLELPECLIACYVEMHFRNACLVSGAGTATTYRP